MTAKQQPAGLRSRLANALSFARLAGLMSAGKPKASRRNEPAKTPKHQAAAPGKAPSSARPPEDRPQQRESEAEAQGRLRERTRIAAILGSPAGQRNFELAKSLAFDTRMTRKEAIALLEATPAPAPRGSFAHPERAAKNPTIGASLLPASKEQATVGGWDRAFAQADSSTRRPAGGPGHGRHA